MSIHIKYKRFYNKNGNDSDLNNVKEIVHIEYETREAIKAKYGQWLTEEDLDYAFGSTRWGGGGSAPYLLSGRDLEYVGTIEEDALQGQYNYSSQDIVEVATVEWKTASKVKLTAADRKELDLFESYQEMEEHGWREDLYQGVRIAGCIYVNVGKVKNVVRSQSTPWLVDFSYGGFINDGGTGQPISLVMQAKETQDMYDITAYFIDSYMANSGVKGSRVNIAGIPAALGDTLMERLFKYLALKKNGLELIDPTQAGAQLFNQHGDFDNSVSGQALSAMEAIKRALEREMDILFGTSPQMLGEVNQRDAVSNVEVGVKQTQIINKEMFDNLRNSQRKLCSKLVQFAQISFSKSGKRGIRHRDAIVGSQSSIFEILPENFCFTDYNIHIEYGSDAALRLTEAKAMAEKLSDRQEIHPETLIKIKMSNSITEINRLIDDSLAARKAENDTVGNLQAQVEQLSKDNEQLNADNKQKDALLSSNENKNIALREKESNDKLAIETRKLDIEDKKANNTQKYNEGKLEQDSARVQLEREQLFVPNGPGGNSREIKNS